MQRKTLLFYINAINGGGAERVILQLAKHFAQAGYRSVLVTSFVDDGKEYPVPENVTRLSIEQEQILQSQLKRNLSRILALRKICKEEKPAAVISFMREPNFRAILATMGLKTKRIVSVRNDPNRSYAGKLGGFVGKVLLPMADGCVFQTEDAKAWFPQRLQKKSKVIMNDVKDEFFDILRQSDGNVVSVGRLSRQKNHALLIRAYAKIADKHPDRKLLLYGKGDLHGELSQLIQQLGMQDQILLQGATQDVPAALSKAGVFVLPSDYEGMPNCLLEALAAGVPSISTDCPCGGPRALIRHGENGLLVPVGDEEALAAALDRLLSDSAFAEQLGANAREAAKDYAPDKVFCQWKQYIEECIAR